MNDTSSYPQYMDLGPVLSAVPLAAGVTSALTNTVIHKRVFWVNRLYLQVQADQPGTIVVYRGDTQGNFDWSTPVGTFSATGAAWAGIGIPITSAVLPLGYQCYFAITNTGAAPGTFSLRAMLLS